MGRIARGSRYISTVEVTTAVATATQIYFGDHAGGCLIGSSSGVVGGTYHFSTSATSASDRVPVYTSTGGSATEVTLTVSSTQTRGYPLPAYLYGCQWLYITTTGTADTCHLWLKG